MKSKDIVLLSIPVLYHRAMPLVSLFLNRNLHPVFARRGVDYEWFTLGKMVELRDQFDPVLVEMQQGLQYVQSDPMSKSAMLRIVT